MPLEHHYFCCFVSLRVIVFHWAAENCFMCIPNHSCNFFMYGGFLFRFPTITDTSFSFDCGFLPHLTSLIWGLFQSRLSMNTANRCQQLLFLIRNSLSICIVMHCILNHALDSLVEVRMPSRPSLASVFDTWLLYLNVIAWVMTVASHKHFCFSFRLFHKI